MAWGWSQQVARPTTPLTPPWRLPQYREGGEGGEERERRFVCIEREKEEKMTASAKDEEKLKTVKLDGRLSNQINSEQAPYE